MDVLIICANRNQHPAPVLPYGACMVAEASRAAGHRVRLLDLMFVRRPLEAIKECLRTCRPDVIGLSARNLDNNDMQAPVEFVSELTEITRTLRALSSAPLVLGGPAVGVMPGELLRATGASWAVLGDGETVFPELLAALEGKKPLAAVPRLAWWEPDGYRQTSGGPQELVPAAVTPDLRAWVDLGAYRSHLAAVPLQSKRGCPFACVYCTYGMSEGRDYRLVPPGEVATAVTRLAAWGVKDIEFVDNVFNAPYDHALAICRHLARTRHRARLMTYELNPAFLDDRLLRAMEEAGFAAVGVTAESAADSCLAGLGKGYTAAEVTRAARAVRRSKLPCFWIFLLGGPGETPETVTETIGFAKRILRPGDVAFLNVGLRVYPGTALESIARAEGSLTATALEMLEPVFYFSPRVEPAWVMEQVRQAAAAQLNILHGGSLSHPWLPAISRLFHRLPLKLPLWRHAPAIRRIIRSLGRDI